MKKIKENWKIEYLFYLFLILSPFLDSFSYLFHTWFPNALVSPTVLLRLVIPIILFVYLFLNQKKRRREIFLFGMIYFIYIIGHLSCYYIYQTNSAYGSIFHEMQYLLNYTYMMVIFYILYCFRQDKKLNDIPRYVSYFLWGYIALLYCSILTGTSSSTYIDGIGYKGWNASGNAVGSILLLCLIIVLPLFKKEKKKHQIILTILTAIYLMCLLGTRVGLLGFPIVIIVFILCNIFFPKRKIILSKIIIFILFTFFILISIGLLFFGTRTLERQKHLEEESSQVLDDKTKEEAHVTGDALSYIRQIEEKRMDEHFMDNAQQKALLDMYHTANQLQLSNSNRRVQQLLYHTYLVKEQHSISRILFGNGYLSNYSEMTLEMEIPAMLYNFGIFGFILYLGIYMWIVVICLFDFFKHINRVTPTYAFYLFGSLFTMGLSMMAGYTFFHVSCMVIIVILYLLLYEERKEMNL